MSQASQRIAQPITGGPPELDELVAQLHCENPFSERAAVIEKICKILEQYPIRNVLGLWSVASDLLLPEQQDEVAEAGYRLLKSCVSWPKLSTIERSIFFDAASLRKNDRFFDQRLQVINALTKRGRDIEACESSIVPFIISSLDVCYKASRDAYNANRKASGKRSVDKPTQEADNLARLLDFAIGICKFNAKILTDEDLELLLGRAVAICQDTSHTSDMENCIRLFDTIITYVHLPQRAIRPCVEVLCTIHRVMDDLQDQTWNTLSNLFQSHVGGVAVLSLLHTLLYGPTRITDKPHNIYRGTYQVLQLLLLDGGRNDLPAVPISLLCPALKASIKDQHPSREELVIRLIDAVLSQTRLRDLLLSETDVGDLIDIVTICAERDDDRRRAKITELTNASTAAVKDGDDKTITTHGHGSPNNRRDCCWFTAFLC